MDKKIPGNTLLFTTGQFASLHQLNKRTLHYYDEIGLFSPAFKGDNDYRFYTYQQSAELENILALRELNMSIEEIMAYQKAPSARAFEALADEKLQAIEESVSRLLKLKNVFQEKKEALRLCAEKEDGCIELAECPPEYLLITPLPQAGQAALQDREGMDTLLTHLRAAWSFNKYKAGCGSIISMEKVRRKSFDLYDALYTHIDGPEELNGITLKPEGTYLQGYCVGSWDRLPLLYGKMLTFAEQNGLIPGAYFFEIGLNEVAISDMSEYMTQISIKVAGNV